MNGYYETLERDLRKVLAEVSDDFDPDHAQEIYMYLDAGEYGLALETICSVLKSKRFSISATVYVEIEALGTRMNVEPRCWRDLEVK